MRVRGRLLLCLAACGRMVRGHLLAALRTCSCGRMARRHLAHATLHPSAVTFLALAAPLHDPSVALALERVLDLHALRRTAFRRNRDSRIGLVLAEGDRRNVHVELRERKIRALRQVIDNALPHSGLVLDFAAGTATGEHHDCGEWEEKTEVHNPIIAVNEPVTAGPLCA